jgi:iron complex outermembrane recepter protein
VVPPISKTFTFNYFDWKAGVELDLAKDIMLYFTVATGHKPGGFNENNGVPFDMESDISGELGIKSRFMENRLQVNTDVFYYKYKGYQVVDFTDVYHPATGITNLDAIFFNAPEARNIGAELNTITLIGDATTLNVNLAYLNNKYSAEFIVHPDNPFVGVDQNGKPMPHSPKFTLKASIDHIFSFSDSSTLKPGLSYRWIGEQYSGIMAIPSMLTPSYSVADASLNFTSTKNWYLNIYANNVFNNHYYTEVFSAGPQLRVYPGAPLQLGIVFNMKL